MATSTSSVEGIRYDDGRPLQSKINKMFEMVRNRMELGPAAVLSQLLVAFASHSHSNTSGAPFMSHQLHSDS